MANLWSTGPLELSIINNSVTLPVNNSASIYYLERQHLLSLAVCHFARLIAENPRFLPFPY